MAYSSSDGSKFTNRPSMVAHEARQKVKSPGAKHAQPSPYGSMTAQQSDVNPAQSAHIEQKDGRYHVSTEHGSKVHESVDDALDHIRGLFSGEPGGRSDDRGEANSLIGSETQYS